jgi:hypothetical protein
MKGQDMKELTVSVYREVCDKGLNDTAYEIAARRGRFQHRNATRDEVTARCREHFERTGHLSHAEYAGTATIIIGD